MNGVKINIYAEGLPAHCPCRGCAACGVFWDGVRGRVSDSSEPARTLGEGAQDSKSGSCRAFGIP